MVALEDEKHFGFDTFNIKWFTWFKMSKIAD